MAAGREDECSAVWVALARAYRLAFSAFEARFKAEALPPMAWYDALWELEKTGDEGLRPFALEKAMLFEQYNLSRLVVRMEKAGLVRRCACADDGRGQVIFITDDGRRMRQRMWDIYRQALRETVADRLSPDEAKALTALLKKLG